MSWKSSCSVWIVFSLKENKLEFVDMLYSVEALEQVLEGRYDLIVVEGKMR